jgi:DNA primase catalytic core
VNVRGVVAAAFTHRDSRAGDPDLHTHVAVANKVQTLDGRWLSIDGRILFKATVAASETYNTALEHHLRDSLGVRFAERSNQDVRKRPVREIVGIHPALLARWSTRRAAIEARRGVLAADFQRAHGRPPTPVESLQLAQQATLETREAKHQPRSLAEQRKAWSAQAAEALRGPDAVQAMVRDSLSSAVSNVWELDAGWLDAAADRVLSVMEGRRSSWQIWHVRAEAQRYIRAADVPTMQANRLLDLLVDEVLNRRSISLARPDKIAEPNALQRSDGASVYTVAGAELFTSQGILAAEQRLVATAGRRDGHATATAAVDVALLEATANGVTLNAGQAALVRDMATSGARLQLAIAPAGAGKTTALRALAAAWRHGGGTVIGLAPSAAAAAVLRDQINTHTETLAKLTTSLQHRQLPDWVADIGPSTLVVIDEAGMADTLSLDAAVSYVVDRGGSVRLIGDDQQLAAISAGGVLRDIQASHGAVRLTELLRFTDPAEAGATLALRDGKPEAIGFYLDNQRFHVGDLSTITEQVFTAWQHERSTGLDSLMLATTRELVAELNRRARSHRLADTPPDTEVTLADGNRASVGELIITRSNDRQLRLTSSDWVKNGDRWTVVAVNASGDLDVQHCRNRHRVRLPAAYVQASAELGYATTVHAAQGLSVDTVHCLATGDESRQQLYTMLTRGKITNHLYVQTVGDGDPHSVIWPETARPSTPTDILEQILARDDAARSATTLHHDQHDPAARLGEATRRYVDALHAAVEDLAGTQSVAAMEAAAEEALPGLTDEPAWPSLRGRLLLLAASGSDPIPQLRTLADVRELTSADDQAAVVGWRLDDTGNHNGFGPLPWLPAMPQRLHDHQTWGPYLAARAAMVAELANRVRCSVAADRPPIWVGDGLGQPPSRLVEDIEVWRAATGVSPDDQRPTGPMQRHKTARIWQRQLDEKLGGSLSPAWHEWAPLIGQIAPTARNDSFAPILASRLAAISHAGINATQLLRIAVIGKPLPDDHPAAALWWRICRHLTPSLSAQINQNPTFIKPWESKLAELVGAKRAEALQASPWWPALVKAVDQGLRRGWRIEDLLRPTNSGPHAAAMDPCQAMVWRISVALDAVPDDEPHGAHLSSSPDDLGHANVPADDERVRAAAFEEEPAVAPSTGITVAADVDEGWLEPDLAVAAMLRNVAGPPEQTDADVTRMFTRAIAWRECPISRERMIEVNQLSLAYFRRRFPSSWGHHYLADRLGENITNDPRFQPGQAPAGWTNLVDHLRQHGVSDDEMIITGVATMANSGRLIDRFRNRVVLPIIHQGEVLGFIGRRRPDLSDFDRAGPKYLNTGETPLFHKGAQLYGVVQDELSDGAVPVIVEGPVDAIAVTLASRGRYLGVAPLGTSLTDEQAAQLARISVHPVVATDADPAGRSAAERDYWMLSCHRLDPLHTPLTDGTDPADLLALKGPTALTQALVAAQPLAERLLQERLANLPPAEALREAARVIAARPVRHWDQDSSALSTRLGVPMPVVRHTLLALVKQWNTDPRQAAQQPLKAINEAQHRISSTIKSPGEEPKTPLARSARRRPPTNRAESTPAGTRSSTRGVRR